MDVSTSTRISEYVDLTRQGSEAFWVRLKKWFIVTGGVGLIVGLAVALLEMAVMAIWDRIIPMINPVTVVLAPTIGLALSGLILQYTTVNPEVHGTEEVIEAFHERGGVFRFRSFPGKVMAAIATVGFGGSAGLEGPSIYLGGAIGSFVLRKIRRFGFTDDDVRTLMIAGAAAGVSAVFKAPLTGIVFALEVPYRDDLTREALIPSLIASVSSYLVLVQFLGVEPLFLVSERYTFGTRDLLFSIAIGLMVGLLARAFVVSFHGFSALARRMPVPLWVRTATGGLLTGLFGLAALKLFGEPVVLGTGYSAIDGLVTGAYTTPDAVWLLVLKAGAVIATLASGAAGGIFIPMIMLGATSGVIVRGVLPGAVGPMFPVVGMAAFLAAGYSTPIAATVFIAETTGGAGYIIPGLVAAAVAFTVAGKTSVSDKQRWRRETRLDRMMGARVGTIMTPDVITLRSTESLLTFVTERMVHLRHKSMPVVDEDGALVGMVGLFDVDPIPKEDWARLTIEDVMSKEVLTVTRSTLIGELVARMAERDIDRVPVVDADDPTALLGIVSTTDVMAMDDMTADWRRKAHAQ
ncbi:MAG: chloride channel protein [Actinomycetota bacterium]|nr:chloride channel protein [Actinomycetota bacterium]